jgi:hypothetical protein
MCCWTPPPSPRARHSRLPLPSPTSSHPRCSHGFRTPSQSPHRPWGSTARAGEGSDQTAGTRPISPLVEPASQGPRPGSTQEGTLDEDRELASDTSTPLAHPHGYQFAQESSEQNRSATHTPFEHGHVTPRPSSTCHQGPTGAVPTYFREIPVLPVPGVWCAKPGSKRVQFLDLTIEMDPGNAEAAQRWCARFDHPQDGDAEGRTIAFE